MRGDWQRILCEEPQIRLGHRPCATDPVDWVEEEFGTVELYDPRLKRRLFNLVRDFYSQPQAPISQSCGSQAKTIAAYRFFNNERVTMDRVLRAHTEASIERIKAHKVVLAVQDTTTLNYITHRATEGLGPIGTSESGPIGLVVHDTMAFTPEGTPLGLLNVQCWARDLQDMGKKHRRKELPIEQKESMKCPGPDPGYRAVCEVQELCPETMLVSVGDRESDLYELFLEGAQNPTGPKLLVRCERSRNRKTEEDDLWEALYIFIHKDYILPDKEPTLRQAIHRVASLGGFLGRKCDGKLGTTSLWRGLQRLEDITATYLALLPFLKSGP